MKTLLKNVLILTLTFGSFVSYANNVLEDVNYIKKGSLISISDAFGEVLYSGKITRTGSISRLFDFSQLKDGKYTMEVTKAFEIKLSTLEIKNHFVTVLKTNQKIIYKPVVITKNATVLISKLSLNTDKIQIELYYEGDLIYEETVTVKNVLNRAYKLDQTLKGNYKAVLTSGDRVFTEDFKI